MHSRKMGFAPFLVGLIGLVQLMGRPRFSTYHTVDVIQLLASGACFAVALMAAFGRLKPKA